jgi:hypothetical protein
MLKEFVAPQPRRQMQVGDVAQDLLSDRWYVKYQKLSDGVWTVVEKGVNYPSPVTVETVMRDWPRALCWPMSSK